MTTDSGSDRQCKTVEFLQSPPLHALSRYFWHSEDASPTKRTSRQQEKDGDERKPLKTNLGHPEEDGVVKDQTNHLDRHSEPSFRIQSAHPHVWNTTCGPPCATPKCQAHEPRTGVGMGGNHGRKPALGPVSPKPHTRGSVPKRERREGGRWRYQAGFRARATRKLASSAGQPVLGELDWMPPAGWAGEPSRLIQIPSCLVGRVTRQGGRLCRRALVLKRPPAHARHS